MIVSVKAAAIHCSTVLKDVFRMLQCEIFHRCQLTDLPLMSPLMNMASCNERQRLEDECESALNDYIDSLRRSLEGRSDSVERHRVLSECRAKLLAHGKSHGCAEGFVKAASAGG